jgi:predicted secreted protein
MSSPVRTNAIVGAESRLSSKIQIAKDAIGREGGIFSSEKKDSAGITVSCQYIAYNGSKVTISLDSFFAIEHKYLIRYIEQAKDENDSEFKERFHKEIYNQTSN